MFALTYKIPSLILHAFIRGRLVRINSFREKHAAGYSCSEFRGRKNARDDPSEDLISRIHRLTVYVTDSAISIMIPIMNLWL